MPLYDLDKMVHLWPVETGSKYYKVDLYTWNTVCLYYDAS